MDKHYDFGIINESNVILFNDSTHEDTISRSDFLEDVYIEFLDNGVLIIKAKLIEYDIYMTHGKVYEDEWERKPEEKLIKSGKKWPWSKPERYVEGGWVRTIERTPVTYVLNKYKVEIYR